MVESTLFSNESDPTVDDSESTDEADPLTRDDDDNDVNDSEQNKFMVGAGVASGAVGL